MLLAQAAPGPGGVPPNMWAIIAGVCSCYLLIFVAYLLVCFFFSRTMYRVMTRCHPDTRAMSPGLAYLNMIPCFNYVWFIITVIQVANTLHAEFADRQLDEEETDYGRTIGLTAGILNLVGSVVPYIPAMIDPQLMLVGQVLALGVFAVVVVLFVVYWVRIAGYGRELADDDDAHARAEDESDDRPPAADPSPPEEPTDAPRD